jgi:hypothetical protein
MAIGFLQPVRAFVIVLMALACCLFVSPQWSKAAEPTDETTRRDDELQKIMNDKIRPIIHSACSDCHGLETSEAGLNLQSFATISQVLRDSKKWRKVRARVLDGAMPPPEAAPLPPNDKQLLVDWLTQTLDLIDGSEPLPGRSMVRRLNREEYRNTIRDLTGIDYAPAQDFPGDDVGYGFDNIAEVMSLPPLLLEKYLDAAEAISQQCLIDRSIPELNTVFPGYNLSRKTERHIPPTEACGWLQTTKLLARSISHRRAFTPLRLPRLATRQATSLYE